MGARPLDGVRILDATLFMVGPWASMLLGAMGAEVLHVEQPDVDWSRLSGSIPPTINGTSIGYITWNMNKRGVFIDFKSESDRGFAHHLIETCDVFLSNMRPGVAERLGMGYEGLRAINPRLIYCSATGYGPVGPRAGDRGSDNTVQAMSGFWSTQGQRGQPGEAYRHYTQLDASTGNTVAQAILLGLYARKRTGKGQHIDVTMFDSAATLQLPRLAEHFEGHVHEPLGSSAFATSPNRAFQCQDGKWVGVSVTSEAEWDRLCGVLADENLWSDERFKSNSDRVRNRKALEETLIPVFASRPQAYWLLQLRKSGVPVGMPMDWETIRHHRQVAENGYVVEVGTEGWGKVWTGGPPWRFSKTPARMTGTPLPGEATFELWEEVDRRSGAAR